MLGKASRGGSPKRPWTPSHCGWVARAPSCGEPWEEVWNVFCGHSVWGQLHHGWVQGCWARELCWPNLQGPRCPQQLESRRQRVVCRVACVEKVPTKEMKVGTDSVSAGSQGIPLREGGFGTHG